MFGITLAAFYRPASGTQVLAGTAAAAASAIGASGLTGVNAAPFGSAAAAAVSAIGVSLLVGRGTAGFGGASPLALAGAGPAAFLLPSVPVLTRGALRVHLVAAPGLRARSIAAGTRARPIPS